MADWGLGWSYVPDYLPTGDELFQTGSFANLGRYTNRRNDTLIKATLNNSDMQLMYRWEDYLTKQLPVVFQPDAPPLVITYLLRRVLQAAVVLVLVSLLVFGMLWLLPGGPQQAILAGAES